jgi:hypothetical protein
MQIRGECGRGGREYGDSLNPVVLFGVLSSDREYVIPDGAGSTPAPSKPGRCEHGRPINDHFKCAKCAWLYGWTETKEA